VSALDEALAVDAHNDPPEQRERALVVILQQAAVEMAAGELAKAMGLTYGAAMRTSS
jgi:hypothetical protein